MDRKNLRTFRMATALTATLAATFALSACGSAESAGGAASGDEDSVKVSLITKTSTNPFFIAMQQGAKAAAEENNVELTIASGKEDGDAQAQIDAIEAAIAGNSDGILITPTSDEVNAAITKAKEAGLFVIALDTPPTDPTIVDITFATDNREAGRLIGQYAAAKLGGEKATIAMLDLFDDQVATVDYDRDQGFLEGMGIDTKDGKLNGDEDATGAYSGGDYEIVGNEATQGSEAGGQEAMEKLLAKNPDINVIYTINEPAAVGAYQALTAAGKSAGDFLMLSVDGGASGVQAVEEGKITATSQQYPLRMAQLGVEAIADIARGGEAPTVSEGLDFYNTGVTLIAKEAVEGVESESVQYGLDNAWG